MADEHKSYGAFSHLRLRRHETIPGDQLLSAVRESDGRGCLVHIVRYPETEKELTRAEAGYDLAVCDMMNALLTLQYCDCAVESGG